MENKFNLIDYVDSGGKNPYKKWFDGLKDHRAKAVIAVRLNSLALGNMGDHKGVGKGVIELRVFTGPGYRVYIGIEEKTDAIILLGAAKGPPKQQDRDIKKAQGYLEDYKNRK